MPVPSRHRLCPLGFVAAALILACSVQANEIHVWKDASGRTHYSDQPPPDVDSKRVGTTSTGSSASQSGTSTAPSKSAAELELEFRKRRAEKAELDEKNAKEKARRQQLAKQCDESRRHLAALEAGQRVARYNSQGEREFLDEQQRASEAEQLRESIRKQCAGL